MFAMPQLLPSWLVPPIDQLTIQQRMAPPTLWFEVMQKLPWAFGWMGCAEFGEGLLLAAMVLLALPLVPVPKREFHLSRNLRVTVFLVLEVATMGFWLFALIDLVGQNNLVQYPFLNYVANLIGKNLCHGVCGANSPPEFQTNLGETATSLFVVSFVSFVLVHGGALKTALRNGLLFCLASVAIFESGLMLFLTWTSTMALDKYLIRLSITYVVRYTNGRVWYRAPYFLASNWTVLAFCMPLAIYGGITIWWEHRRSVHLSRPFMDS